jgi:hypothetical protein
MMSLERKLLSLNERGIFPGPLETEEGFFSRVDLLIFREGNGLGAHSLVKKIFNSTPDWVEIITRSKGLLPREGAATWIEECPEKGRSCRIQIKDSFLTRLYAKDEVIAHEMVHAMRLMFDEKRFEEILAYRTSKSRFRRYFGPLFSSPKESKCFVLILLLSWTMIWFEMEYALLCPLVALGYGLFRLWRSQRLFSKALRNLQQTIRGNALAAALHLTDAEIVRFAKSTPEEIRAFAIKEQDRSVRWKQLFAAYF